MRRRIPEQVIGEIRDRVSLQEVVEDYVHLLKDGQNYKGLCPFHKEKTPSFKIHPGQGYFKCFGCGESGNAISFVMKMEGLSFVEAAERLAARAGINFEREWSGTTEKKQNYYDAYKLASEFYRRNLTGEAIEYLKGPKRGLKDETIESWGIGYSPFSGDWDPLTRYLSNQGLTREQLISFGLSQESSRGTLIDRFRERIMIPVRDRRGQTVGFSGRMFPDQKDAPKFLTINTPFYNKEKTLFGLYEATRAISKQRFAVFVEGYFDAIVAHQEGFKNVVAFAGVELTDSYVDAIARLTSRCVICLDPDNAGREKTVTCGRKLLEHGLQALVAQLPEGNDPDVFIISDRERFREIISDPGFLIDFQLDMAGNSRQPDEVTETIRTFLYPTVYSAQSLLLKDRYLNSIANRFGIEERIVRADFRSWRMSKSPQRSRDQADIELAVLSHLARNPTQRRSAGSRLRPDQFSAIERELFFEFLTGSNDIDNILLRPEDAISDLPLWQGVTCDDLEKSFLGYCSSMSVEMNPENSARLFAQIARRRSDDSHCISALRKSFFEKQAHDLEMRIISAEKSGNGQLALELTAQRIVLDKEGAESG